MPALPLYISPSLSPQPTATEISTILQDIRSTGYIAEVTSNEVPPEESGLWNTIYHVPLPLEDGQDFNSQESLSAFTEKNADSTTDVELSNGAYVLVDERTIKGDGSLLVVETDGDSLRVARRSCIEVVSGLIDDQV